MLRRLLPTLVALGLGLVALLVFLGALLSVFVEEDHRGAAQEVQERRALQTYATTTLQRMLADRLEALSRRVDEVQVDPLVDDSGLVWAVDGVRALPRVAASGKAPVVEAAYQALLSPRPPGAVKGAEPRDERERLLRTLEAAEARRDEKAIERSMRAFLEHRAHWQLAPEDDLPLTLAALESLSTRSTPSAVLLKALLRDGLQGAAPMEGLQRQVLRAWSRLSGADLAFSCAEVARQSRRAQVPVEDFEARCAAGGEAAPLPAFPGSGRFLAGEGVSWVRGGEVRGGRVDLKALITVLRSDMLARGLLGEGDALAHPSQAAPTRFEALTVGVVSPRFAAATRARRQAFELKSALVLVTGLLGLFLGAVALVAQRRKLTLVELKADFVATVSHELRTPLASLRVMAETLEWRLEGSEEARDYPSRMVAEVDGLSFLVENILSFNRIDKGRWAPRKAPLPLASLKAVLEEDARTTVGVTVAVDFEGWDSAVVWGDLELLRLLLLNLQRNACRYNERQPVQLHWRARVDGGEVQVTLEDNGVGIPPAQWEAVFKEFERPAIPRGRGGPGSGLGLALCRRIAALHGGGLKVARSSPEGTIFELTLLRPVGSIP